MSVGSQEAQSSSAWAEFEELRTKPTIRLRGWPSSTAVITYSADSVRDPNLRPVNDRTAPWVSSVARRMNELALLAPMSPLALEKAVGTLFDPVWSVVPEPLVGLTDEGGIIVEFRSDAIELHIEFEADGSVAAYALNGPVEWEGPLDEIPEGLDKWAWRLADFVL